MRNLFILVISLIAIFVIMTFVFHKGKLYIRDSFTPISISDSKISGTFIDSFENDNLREFEIWRCYLKFVDYYGLGGLYSHKYIPEDSFFYIALRYKGKAKRNFCFSTKYSELKQYKGACFNQTGNGYLLTEKYRKHDTIPVYIFEQPGDTSSNHLLDSIYIAW